MLLLEKLSGYRLILGSKSPRRNELLKGMLSLNKYTYYPFEVIVKETEEKYPAILPINEVPKYLALKKAEAFTQESCDKTLIITADTIVILNGIILEKPHTIDEAKRMLAMLSGIKHEVLTGVCLRENEKYRTFDALSEVSFRNLNEDEINFYAEHFVPLDKAGSYGVQEWIGYIGIEYISGSYFNVMGLPVQLLYSKLLSYEI